MPDPNDPKPTPDNPNPEPARPPSPPETPPPDQPPGIPSPSPDPVPSPGEEPVQIPPGSPPEIPSQPTLPGPTASSASPRIGSLLVAAALCCFMGMAMPVAAQSLYNGTETAPADPCQVKPDEDSGQTMPNRSAEGELSPEELQRCKGLLKPPQTGDQEIVEPPPETGTTPVIPPGSVPEQPPN